MAISSRLTSENTTNGGSSNLSASSLRNVWSMSNNGWSNAALDTVSRVAFTRMGFGLYRVKDCGLAMNAVPSSVRDNTPNSSVFLLKSPASVICRMIPGQSSGSAMSAPDPMNSVTFSPA